MSTTPALEVRDLRAGYHRLEVVHGISFSVAPGEVVALFGPNGAGKTTTLLSITGHLPPLGGDVRWNGRSGRISPYRLARQGVALVAERSVFMQLTTEANLRLGQGAPERALETFPELKPLLKQRAGLLSGGQQQILTMARALAGSPSVLLLDEVSAGLAPIVVARLFEAARLAASNGVAIVLVEQQIRRALSVADRGYVLNRGDIAFAGDRQQLRDHLSGVPGAYFA